MNHMDSTASPDTRDFFISCNSGDRDWVLWLRFVLRELGGLVTCDMFDDRYFPNGINIPQAITDCLAKSHHTIALVSRPYVAKDWPRVESSVALAKDPMGRTQRLIVLRIEDCELPDLIGVKKYDDVFGLKERDAIETVLRVCGGARQRSFDIAEIMVRLENHDRSTRPAYPPSAFSATVSRYRERVEKELHDVLEQIGEPERDRNSSKLFYGFDLLRQKHGVDRQIAAHTLRLKIEELRKACNSTESDAEKRLRDICEAIASCRWRVLVTLVSRGLNKFSAEWLIDPFLNALAGEAGDIEGSVSNLTASARALTRATELRPSSRLAVEILSELGNIARLNGISMADLLSEDRAPARDSGTSGALKEERPKSPQEDMMIYFRDENGAYADILRALSEMHVDLISTKSYTLAPNKLAMAEMTIHIESEAGLLPIIRRLFAQKRIKDLVLTVYMDGDAYHPDP